MKYNRRLRTEYSKIIQPIQIPKYRVYVYCTHLMIALCDIKYYMDLLNSGKTNNCHAQSHINLELVLWWYGEREPGT